MSFQKGVSGNPTGRPKGSINLVTKSVREILTDCHALNFEQILLQMDKMTLRERLQFNRDILPYIAPKLSNIQIKEDAMSYDEMVAHYQLTETIKLLSTDELIDILERDK